MVKRKVSSTYTRNEQCVINCDLTFALQKIGGRWKILILSKLEKGKCRFTDIKNELTYMSERMLSLQLRALERDGLVKRTMFAEVPPRVEYELTNAALELLPVFKQLSDWGSRHRERMNSECSDEQ